MNISIVTPSYNQGKYIERTIQSVQIQKNIDYQIEHIIFDGKSTDNTIEILNKYDSKIRWSSEADGGQANAVNKGISICSGDIIGWLNSDDIYYPGAFAKVRAIFLEHPDVDVIYGQASHIDQFDIEFEEYPTEPWNFERLKFHCFICQPALFFRKSVIDRFGLLDENLQYCMDYEYWLRLAKGGAKFLFLEEKLAGSRMYPQNKTLGARTNVHFEINQMFLKQFGSVPDRWIFNYAHAKVDDLVSRNLEPKKYTLYLCLISIFAALRWNKKVNKATRFVLWDWLKKGFF